MYTKGLLLDSREEKRGVEEDWEEYKGEVRERERIVPQQSKMLRQRRLRHFIFATIALLGLVYWYNVRLVPLPPPISYPPPPLLLSFLCIVCLPPVAAIDRVHERP